MTDWTLIYSTDGNGAVTTGSVGALNVAVRAAADVKVLYSSSPGVWWSRQCLSVSTRPGGGGTLISATYSEAVDTTAGVGGLEFNVPFAVENHIYNSTGVRNVQKISGTGDVVAEDSKTIPMRWYVRDYELPFGFKEVISAVSAVSIAGLAAVAIEGVRRK